MKIIVDYQDKHDVPRLVLFIHGAPHRRMHRKVFDEYRKQLIAACKKAGMKLPLKHQIDVTVYMFDPTSPDNGNIYLALEMCLDGKSRGGVVEDDSLIRDTVIKKLWTKDF